MNEEDRKALFAGVVGVVRGSSALAAQDIEFYKSLDKSVADSASVLTDDIVSMINSVLGSIDEHCEPLEDDKESFTNSWNDISNVIDNLFEKSDRSLDILSKRINSAGDVSNNMQFLDKFGGMDDSQKTKTEKPQLKFATPVDNSESHPFVPLLKEKPNALKSLDDSLVIVPAEEDSPEHYNHPYEYEIDHEEYNENILQKRDPIPSRDWNDTEAMWVDNTESLKQMIKEIKPFSELAIDLEHHDYRSYYGIVCLMQISTREKDYLIDTIALRDDLQALNEIFTDPMVTKVLHGAFMDIIWLQRDLGLYIVSLFDTFHASRAMGLPRHSLAFLLEKYANFKTSKKYQLADWRVRPLSKAMNAYAKADTHFLLNIFDQMRNQLVESNKLAGVLAESRNVAKRRFEYSKYRPKKFSPTIYSPIENQHPWKSLMFKYNIPMDKEELTKELYNWRDLIARRDDESPRYVMPNQIIASLVAYTPTDAVGVVSVNHMVTDHVRSNSKVIANLIKNCLVRMKEQGCNITSDIVPPANNEDDEYGLINKISVSQIQSIKANFSTLVKSLVESKQAPTNSSEELETSNFFGKLHNNDTIIKYTSDSSQGKEEVSTTTIDERGSDYKQKLQLLDEIDLEVPVIQPPIIPVGELPVSTESAANVSATVTTPAVPELQEDLDEIIVLKKVKRDHASSNRSNNAAPEESLPEAIDYSKATKVLSSNNNNNKKGRNNKRKFDPFSAIQEGPQAMKKRKAGTRGKNMSFKR
mgnify:FL=1